MKKRARPKIVYIAHPISGAVKTNISKVEKILDHIFETTRKVYPIAPYLDACRYLENSDENKEFAFMANKKYFDDKFIDELWVCSDDITSGVRQEILWAIANGISIIFKAFEDI